MHRPQVRTALQPKFLPKERFQLIEHAHKLLTKKESELAEVMETYLKVRSFSPWHRELSPSLKLIICLYAGIVHAGYSVSVYPLRFR